MKKYKKVMRWVDLLMAFGFSAYAVLNPNAFTVFAALLSWVFVFWKPAEIVQAKIQRAVISGRKA